MTTVIDERVVEMRFNNEDFEKNVAQSMSTLEKLKNSLNFDSGKSLENLGKAAKNVDLSGMSQTITEATTKFSALEIAGITALANITNKAVDFGINFAKSLSIDQVTSGFDKYAVKTQSVQTIMAATADQFANQAEQMEYVNEQLDKLTWFTDETSYSMIDMTSNIGKFVSNNIALEDAVTAMEGIATWAGLSGAGVTEASRAMYNFSQAMGAGAMKLQDWKSIENANMATTKFKQTAIDTAVELGKLKQSADGLVTTLDGKTEVSITSFSESLKKKWFDTEVMTQTLGKFGKFSDELYNLSNATNLTASELLEALDDYKAGTLDMNEIARDSTMSVADLNEKFKELSGEGFELGKKAFAASQEAKTFKEAIDSVKDAVSSGWMDTFEIIFGNYLEAKKLWTGLANNLYDMFAEGGNKRNEVLAVWKELGGRNSLIMGAVNALNLVIKPLNTVKAAFESMLPKGREFGKLLNQLTYRFYIFTSRLQPSQEFLNNLYQFFRGVFSIGKVFLQFITQLINAVVKLVSPAKSLFELVGSFLGKVGQILQIVSFFITETGLIQTAVSFVIMGIQKLAGVLKTVAVIFAGGIFIGIKTFISLIQKATTIVTRFVNVAGNKLAGIGQKISTAFSKVTGIFDRFSKNEKKNTDVTLKMGRAYDSAGKLIGGLGTATKDAGFQVAKEATLLDKFIMVVEKAKNVLLTFTTVIGGAFVTLGTKIFKFFTDFKQRYQDITKSATTWKDYIVGIFKTIGSLFADGWEKVKEFFAQFDIDLSTLQTAFATIKDGLTTIIDKLGPGRIAAFAFATAILALVGAAIKLSDSFRSMFGAVSGVFNNINKILKKQFAKSSVITDLAKAFAIIAGALTLLAFVDATYHDNLENVSKIMLKLMVAFTLCAAALRGLDLLLSKFDIDTDFNSINSNILALAASMTLLVAAFGILNLVELKDDWLKKLGIMAIMFAEITVAAAVLSKVAPSLSKGSFLLLALALSMKLMVDALSKIGEKDIDGVNKNLAGFTVLFLGVAALTAAAGKLKLTSAINLLLVAKALQILMPQIQTMLKEIGPIVSDMCTRLEGITIDFTKVKELAKKAFDKANEFFNYLYERFDETTATTLSLTAMILGTIAGIAGLAAVVASGFALAAIIRAIGSLGNVLKGFGIAVIGLAIGIRIVTDSIKELGEYFKGLDDAEYSRLMSGFALITIIMTAAIGIATLLDMVATRITMNALFDGQAIRTSFIGIAAAFVGIGLAMRLIVASLKDLEGLNPDTFGPVILGMMGLLAALSLAAAAAGTITKGGSALIGLIGIAATMAILIAELGVLSLMISSDNQAQMMIAFVGMLSLFFALYEVLKALGKLKAGPIASLMLPLLGIVMSLTGLVIVLAALENPNYGAMIIGLAGVVGVLIALGRIMKYIVDMPNLGGGRGLKNKIKLLEVCTIALAAVALAVAGMGIAAKFLGTNLLGGLAALLGGLILLGAIFAFITKAKALNNVALMNKLKLLGASIIALGSVAIILSGVAYAISKVGATNALAAFGILSAQLIVVAGIMTWITKMKAMNNDETRQKILLLAACALALIPLSIALSNLSKQEIEDNWNSLFILSAGLAALTGVMVAITKVVDTVVDIGTIVGAIGIILSACGLILSLSQAIYRLSEIDATQLDAATNALKEFATALGEMFIVIGIIDGFIVGIASLFAPGGAGGWAGMFALPALIISIGLAAIAMGYGLKLAAEGIRTIGDAFSDMASSLEKINGLNLSAIANGMYEMAGAGLALGAAAGSVSAFATAMDGLASALGSLNAAKSGGGSGPKGVTFEYFEGANDAMIKSTENMAATVETVTKDIPKNYTDMVVECESGVLENAPKVEAATEDLFNRPWKSLNQMEKAARDAGYHTVDAYVEAINSGVEKTPDFSKTKGVLATFAKDATETVKETASTEVDKGLKELGGNITSFFTSGELSGLIGNAGSYLGKLFGGNMAYNAIQIMSQMMGSFDWMFNLENKIMGKAINQFGANGMPTSVIDKMYGGKAYSDKLNGIVKIGEKLHGVNGWLKDDFLGINEIINDAKDAFTGAGESAEGFGDAASGGAGKAGKALEGLRDTLKDTIGNQLDMFSKFEIKMGVTGDQMIENMKSNIDGFASWSHRMTVLAERFAQHGISDTLYKKLAELGPKGYETMNAFYQMTDEQLEEVRGLWETGLTLPEGQADIVASGFQYMGEMSTQGFSNALDDHKAAHAAAQFGKAALKGIADALGIASPSKETFKQGVFAADGFGKGLTSESAKAYLKLCVEQITEYILQLFDENLSVDVMAEAGTGILTNLFEGILGESIEGNPVMLAFIETFTNFELIDEAIQLFVDHIKEFLYELFEISADEAPSEWFKRLVEISIMNTVIESLRLKEIELITMIETICKDVVNKIAEIWQMEAGDEGFGRSEVFYNLGIMAMQGLLDGIEEKGAECIERAGEIAQECIDIMNEAFDNGSPSKIMRQMGIFVMEGLAIGFDDTAKRVYTAAKNVTDGSLDVMNDGMGRIQDVINTDMDFNPIITPMLDLSLIRSQIAELDSLMNNPSYGIGQNEGNSVNGKNPSQITFTQNNYSPKALTRYEIYRQTKKQLSQLKGALG